MRQNPPSQQSHPNLPPFRPTPPKITAPKQSSTGSSSKLSGLMHMLPQQRQRQNKSRGKYQSQNYGQERGQDRGELYAGREEPVGRGKRGSYRGNRDRLERQATSASSKHNGGILINVNIQDLIHPKTLSDLQNYEFKKQQTTPKKQKNTIVWQQYKNNNPGQKSNFNPKINPIDHLLQFQCDQQLSYTRLASPGPKQRTLHKPPHKQKKEANIPSMQKPHPPPQPSPHLSPHTQKQLLSAYDNTIPELNSISNTEALLYLDTIHQQYRVNPNYIRQCQPNFSAKMRAIVVDWMMQVANEYELKRETFHISVNLFDRVLQREGCLARGDFQVYAAAAMFVASKLEEFQPKKVDDFVLATDNLMNEKRLRDVQIKVCQLLNFKLNPPTLFRWANRLMMQWDTYIKTQLKSHPFFLEHSPKYFKQSDYESYQNFRLLIQLVDCSMLDIQTCQYSHKLVICSFMYLYLTKSYKIYTKAQICQTFPNSSLYLFDQNNLLNQIFSEFVQFTFGFYLHDLLPTIQYCATFMSLQQNLRPCFHNKSEQFKEQLTLEQYENYQSYDCYCLGEVGARIGRKEKEGRVL